MLHNSHKMIHILLILKPRYDDHLLLASYCTKLTTISVSLSHLTWKMVFEQRAHFSLISERGFYPMENRKKVAFLCRHDFLAGSQNLRKFSITKFFSSTIYHTRVRLEMHTSCISYLVVLLR